MDELSKRLKETMATPITITTASETSLLSAKVLRQVWAGMVVLTILIGALFVVTISLNHATDDITKAIQTGTEATLANREAGFKNRALSCRVLINLGTSVNNLPSTCGEADILKYYNPLQSPTAGSNSPAQIKNRALLCEILRIHDQEPPDCMSADAPVPGFN